MGRLADCLRWVGRRVLRPVTLGLVVGGALLALGATRPVDVARLLVLLNGSPSYLGTITATAGTPQDNASTASPFTVAGGSCVHLRCLAASYWIPGVAHGSFVDAQSELAQANATTKDFCLTNGQTTLAIDPVSGTTSCIFFLDQ